jgi:Protein of unknown function (DUF2752)
MSTRAYAYLNYIVAGMILVIFLYAAIYHSDSNYQPIKCVHEELLGKRCPTCGLIDGFSAIIKGRFNDAQIVQPNSIKVFLFLMVQLLMRAVALILLRKTRIPLKTILRTDVILSLLFFILAFKNMIPQIFYIYYKMMLTGS